MNILKIATLCFLLTCFSGNSNAEGLPANPWSQRNTLQSKKSPQTQNFPLPNQPSQIQELDLQNYDRQIEYNVRRVQEIKENRARMAAEMKRRRQEMLKQQENTATSSDSTADFFADFENLWNTSPTETKPPREHHTSAASKDSDWSDIWNSFSNEDLSSSVRKKITDGLDGLTGINVQHLLKNTLNSLQ